MGGAGGRAVFLIHVIPTGIRDDSPSDSASARPAYVLASAICCSLLPFASISSVACSPPLEQGFGREGRVCREVSEPTGACTKVCSRVRTFMGRAIPE